MAHYAFLDENNIVVEVIPGKEENEDGIDWEVWYSEFRQQPCKRTSYNTSGNKHATGGTPFRKNFAGIGFTYDPVKDAFIPPKPYPNWKLDDESCLWVAPTPYPNDGLIYIWNEEVGDWQPYVQANA